MAQVAELLPCMADQLQGLWLLANQQLPALAKTSRLAKPGLAVVQENTALAHAVVQSFVELCR